MKLHLAEGLSLPLDTVTQKLAWLGVTGSGKTYGASKLAELLWHAGAQIVVVDPVGVWYGIRLAKNGKKPSAITIPIFGGLHGDVPLEPAAGALIANLIVDKTLSAVIDVSQFESDADKARFAKDFADRFFFRKKAAPSAVHLFLEECQEFVPQNPQKGEERMLHAFTRLQKLGRNFGVGSSYISQRPQEVNKKALNMAQTLFVFRTTGTQERAAIEKWIEDKALDEDIAGDLPKIATGHCHVWSPEFLKISETVHILEKETFNASATPEVGAAAVTRVLAPIDLERVRTDMAATIEKAKADDPRELRKQIAELTKKLSSMPVTLPTERKAVSTPVLTEADRALLTKLADGIGNIKEFLVLGHQQLFDEAHERMLKVLHAFRDDSASDIAKMRTNFEQRLDSKGFQKILDKLSHIQPPQASAAPRSPLSRRVDPAPSTSRPARQVSASSIGEGEAGLKKASREILKLLSQYAGDGCEIGKIALLTGYRDSGGFKNALAALRSAGFMTGDNTGVMRITKAGLDYTGGPADPMTVSELRDYWAQHRSFKAASRAILALLLDHPAGFTIDEIARRTNYADSGGFKNALAALRTAGVLVGRNTEVMRASQELFS